MKNLTQNRRCRFSDIAAYVLCKFSAAVATSGASTWLPMKPLANEPAAWANAPYKNKFYVHNSQKKSLTQNRRSLGDCSMDSSAGEAISADDAVSSPRKPLAN